MCITAGSTEREMGIRVSLEEITEKQIVSKI